MNAKTRERFGGWMKTGEEGDPSTAFLSVLQVGRDLLLLDLAEVI